MQGVERRVIRMSEPIRELSQAQVSLHHVRRAALKVRTARGRLQEALQGRDRAVVGAWNAGATLGEIAKAVGVSRQRVADIVETGATSDAV